MYTEVHTTILVRVATQTCHLTTCLYKHSILAV